MEFREFTVNETAVYLFQVHRSFAVIYINYNNFCMLISFLLPLWQKQFLQPQPFLQNLLHCEPEK